MAAPCFLPPHIPTSVCLRAWRLVSNHSLRRRFFSPGSHKWQNWQFKPFLHTPCPTKAQGLHAPNLWSADPRLGYSAVPTWTPATSTTPSAHAVLALPALAVHGSIRASGSWPEPACVPALVEPPTSLLLLESESVCAPLSNSSSSNCRELSAPHTSASRPCSLPHLPGCMPKGSGWAVSICSKSAGGLELTLRIPINFSREGDLCKGVSMKVFLMWYSLSSPSSSSPSSFSPLLSRGLYTSSQSSLRGVWAPDGKSAGSMKNLPSE
mmetsp:Transcript_23633/g.67790  ORF Transcript_23633/g.67790 Transcript_23633/m.67790 type:complete len:267 (+) Transcript_23633:365-1165(+)